MPATFDSRWSEADIDALVRLWQSGHSGSEIGEKIGRERGAVLGKIYRLRQAGQADLARVERRPTKPKPPRPVKPRVKARPAKPRDSVKPAPQPIKIAPVPIPIPISSHAVNFLERRRDQCVFPLWGPDDSHRLVCGAPVDADHQSRIGGDYCTTHRRLCVETVDQRKAAQAAQAARCAA